MKHAIWIGMMALSLGALGACGGSRATCEKVMKRAVECSAEKLSGGALGDSDQRKEAMSLADGMISEVCKEDEAQREVPKLEECTSKSDCADVNACLEKAGGGLGL